MSDRRKLSNRRASETVEFDHGGLTYIAKASRYGNGELAELFLDGPKIGSAAQIAARDAAILASLALQHGVSTAAMLHALEKLRDGSPAGPVGMAIALLEQGRA